MEQNAQAQAKPIKIPGPEHPISVERNSSRVVVSVAGRVIADTREALTLLANRPQRCRCRRGKGRRRRFPTAFAARAHLSS
jgi:uncharacterized protein (DUF427 family)